MFDSAFHSFHFGCKPSAFPSYRNCPFDVFLLLPLRFQIPLSSIESPLYTHKHKTTWHEWKDQERNQFNPKPPPSLRVIANLLIVMSVSGENCFKCFFLRARPIPLPLVLSYYVRGLNLLPCARRLCHNTSLTAQHRNVINNTCHFLGQYRHMPGFSTSNYTAIASLHILSYSLSSSDFDIQWCCLNFWQCCGISK